MNETADLRESKLRSILKAVSYRVVGTITTWLIAFVVTGDAAIALAIGAVEPVVKTLVYYLHERAWQQLPRGTVRRVLSRQT